MSRAAGAPRHGWPSPLVRCLRPQQPDVILYLTDRHVPPLFAGPLLGRTPDKRGTRRVHNADPVN